MNQTFSILQLLGIKFEKNPHQTYFFLNQITLSFASTRFSHLNYVRPIPKFNKCKYGISYRGQFTWKNFLNTTDKHPEKTVTDVAKFKAVTKSKSYLLENEVSYF